jgi:hypothetical protein
MTLDFGTFTRASTLIHSVQGLGLLALGAGEAYSADNPGGRAALAGPLALLAAALAGPLIIFWLPGGLNLEQARLALQVRHGFYLFISFSCFLGAAGLSRFMSAADGRKKSAWEMLFLAFLALTGALCFLMASRVSEEASREVMVWHAAMGTTLLLAVALRAAQLFSGRRVFNICWIVLLLATGMQLLIYRESAAAFGVKMVTLQAGPASLPAVAAPASRNNVPSADKKRARR